MDLVSTIRKSGSRGGVNFSWDEVANSNHRENYLGHSLKAPVGRWQQGRDLTWYSKDKGEAEDEKAEEMRKIKQAEEEAMAKALGLPPPNKDATGGNEVEVQPGRGFEAAAERTMSGDREARSEKRERRHRSHRREDSDRRERRRDRSRSRDKARERDRERRGGEKRHERSRRGDDRRRSRSRSVGRHDRRRHRHERRSLSSDDEVSGRRRSRSRSRDRRRYRSRSRERTERTHRRRDEQ